MNRPAPAPQSAFNRAKASNQPHVLPGVDGRSATARRYRDLVEDLTAELGPDLTEAALLQVRTAAAMQLHVELLSARVVRGEPADSEELTRAANVAIRALAALRRRPPTKRSPTGGAAAYLASKGTS